MNFIRKHILGPGERIAYLARLHWIYILMGAEWLIAFLAMGFGLEWLMLRYGAVEDVSKPVEIGGFYLGRHTTWIFWAFAATGIMAFTLHLLKVISTEIALTDSRIIYKTGLIFVEVEEIELNEVQAEHVHHGLLGSLLNYGAFKLDSRFVGDIHLPAIRNPYRFLRAIHKTRARSHDALSKGLERA